MRISSEGPGINRERDMARALRLISGHEPAMVWHAETSLPKGTDLVVAPGGFSYGDTCAAAPSPRVRRSWTRCAILLPARAGARGLQRFPNSLRGRPSARVLMRNARLKFICHDVHLRVERSGTPLRAAQCRSDHSGADRAWRGNYEGTKRR